MKSKNTKKRLKLTLCALLCGFFAGTAIFSAYMLISLQSEYSKSKAEYDGLLQYVEMPSQYDPDGGGGDGDETDDTDDATASDTDAIIDHETEAETDTDTTDAKVDATETDAPKEPADDTPLFPKVNFEALSGINPDVKAWIYIEGTNINYPIVQGEDNIHYLQYTFEGEKNRVGSIYIDYRCRDDFSDRNTVIYGHRLSNKTMFTALKNYKKQSYYDEHPRYVIVTPEKNYVVEIFSGYVASVEDTAWKLNFTSDMEFSDWLADTKSKSKFKSDVTPTAEDHIITLSTCTYEFDNARYVLFGVLREVE